MTTSTAPRAAETAAPDAATGDGPSSPPPPRTRRLRDALPLRRPRLIALLGLAFVLVALVGSAAPSSLKAGGFDDPSSDSVAAARALEQLFPGSQPNVVILVEDAAGGIDSPAATEAGQAVLAGLEDRTGVHVVGSWFETPIPQLRSEDGTTGLTMVRVDGDEDTSSRVTAEIYEDLGQADGPVPVTFGGIAHINNETTTQVNEDLLLAEAIAVPLTLLLLFFVFRGVVAALLPTGIGILSILGSLAVLNLLSNVTDVSIFAVQLVTTLGLGLAIDYSLLIVARYREERAVEGVSDVAALRTTLRTAGRTVLFSAAVVASALATLLVFPIYFLRSSAYAGLAVVAVTLIGALVLLPAVLLLLGRRLDAWSLRRKRPAGPPADRFWGRIAGVVMRRPLLLATPVVAVLVLMAVPLANAQVGVPDERMLPAASESRVVTETLRDGFGLTTDQAVNVVAPDWGTAPDALAGYAGALSQVDGVAAVDSAAGRHVDGALVAEPGPAAAGLTAGDATQLQVLTDVVSYSAEGRQLATDIRTVPVPDDRTVLVGGAPAQIADIIDSIVERLPIALALIALLTMTLLFLFTGSVLLPIKALLFNVLLLAGIFGAAVWVFQEGNLADLLGVTPSPIAVSIPVLLFCVAFGLSMDYELFLLARIKERFDATGDQIRSVREGLGAGGPVIAAAAAILAVSFFSMGTSAVTPIKLFGLGTGLAILIDAILVRGVLVPAFLRLVGPKVWWAPRPLRAVHAKFGISD